MAKKKNRIERVQVSKEVDGIVVPKTQRITGLFF